MSNDNKEAKKEELLEKQEARKLTEEELEQVTGGDDPAAFIKKQHVSGGSYIRVKGDHF